MSDAPVPMRVEVVDLDIPFSQMVWLIIKWTLAAIPAALIFAVFWLAIVTTFGAALPQMLGY